MSVQPSRIFYGLTRQSTAVRVNNIYDFMFLWRFRNVFQNYYLKYEGVNCYDKGFVIDILKRIEEEWNEWPSERNNIFPSWER
jgi:hypothetical protein